MWKRSVRCPVDAQDRELVEESFVWLAQRFGLPPGSHWDQGAAASPISAFFPRRFAGSPDQMNALVGGVGAAMGLEDAGRLTAVPLVRRGTGARGLTGCSGYPDGAFRRAEEARVVALDPALAARPVALLATVAHMLGHLRFAAQRRVPADRATRELLIEFHAVYTGFGVFGANAAVEREIDAPSANARAAVSLGLRQTRPTFQHSGYVSEQLHGYALASYAFARGESRPRWIRHLDANPRTYTRRSLRYLEQHPAERLLDLRAGAVPQAAARVPGIS